LQTYFLVIIRVRLLTGWTQWVRSVHGRYHKTLQCHLVKIWSLSIGLTKTSQISPSHLTSLRKWGISLLRQQFILCFKKKLCCW